jgi:hypothetical protein
VNWLAQNYKWLFDGLGAALLVTFIGIFLPKWLKKRHAQSAGAAMEATNSNVTTPPVAPGSGITQTVNVPTVNVNIGQPAPAPVPASQASSETERAHPDVRLTGTRSACVTQFGPDLWKDDQYEGRWQNALVAQFVNEARPGSRHAPVLARASLVYTNNEKDVLRTTGCWVNEPADMVEFRIEEAHDLIVCLLAGRQLIAPAKRRVRAGINSDRIETHHHPLPSFLQGSVRVRLTNTHTGDLLFEGRFRVSTSPFRISPE